MSKGKVVGTYGWASLDRSWVIDIWDETPGLADPAPTSRLITDLNAFLALVRRAGIKATAALYDGTHPGGSAYVVLRGLEYTNVHDRLGTVLRRYFPRYDGRVIDWRFQREIDPRRARKDRRGR